MFYSSIRRKHLFTAAIGAVFLVAIGAAPNPALAKDTKIGSTLPAELQRLYDCRAMTDPVKKAECYDSAMDAFDTARQSGEIATVTRQEIEEVQRDSFGFNIPSLPKISSIFGGGDKDKKDKADRPAFEELISPIKSVRNTGSGKMRFELANGQIWVQASDSPLAAKRIMRKDVRVAHIQRASLGSFKLQVNGKGPSVKVKRLD